MNLDNTPTGQVDELTALFVIMFWGQPMVDLIERARKALLMPDAKDSAVCQMAIALKMIEELSLFQCKIVVGNVSVDPFQVEEL